MSEGSHHLGGWRNVPDGRWARSTFFLSHVWALFKGDRALMVVAAVGTALNVVAGAILFGLAAWILGGVSERLLMGVAGAAIALPSTVASTYCNVALLRMAQARFEGRRCTARQGFAAANRRLGAILAWSLLSVGVGAVLNWLAEKLPFAGALTAWLAGAAWSLATMFAVPVLALEDAGARRAARRSVEIFRARWGEGIAGTVSVAAVASVIAVPGLILIMVGIAAAGAAGIACVAAGGALVLAATALTNALDELFALAVYRFETSGAGSFGFEPGQLDGFVELKRTGRRG